MVEGQRRRKIVELCARVLHQLAVSGGPIDSYAHPPYHITLVVSANQELPLIRPRCLPKENRV
ncbi:hypothetical protein Hamer_G022396 [Homarus americanus]|uniref:Uncharacterized protein n=1 Tax=Homarus americanus TaxID=6706 RepID=A0A8J5N9N3_HOMAM|nr:hypothetical protein Hamer_G022396 [Homarus americanus]